MSRNVKDTTGLSRLYHLNSEPWVNEHATPNTGFVQTSKSAPDAARIPLPETEHSPLDQLAEQRRSVRAFADTPLPLAKLAAILRCGYRAIGPAPQETGQRMLRRPVPSAGGLYPLELYALVRNVDGIAPGVYHYDAVGDALECVREGAWEDQAQAAFLTWSFVEHAPVIICIGAVFERCQSKYGPRGYRYILLEAGHVGQNMCLNATQDGLSTLFLGGYHDRVLNDLVALDGTAEAVVYTMALGEAV